MKTLERGSGRGSIARSPVLGNPSLDANQLNQRDERYDRVASGQNVEGDVLRTRRKGRVRHVFFGGKFEVCVGRSGEERGRAAHLSLRVGPPALLIARRPGRGGSGGVASPEHPVDRHVGALLCGGARQTRFFTSPFEAASRARLGPTLLVPSESIDEHCAAHLWRLRPEVRDDAVVTRPSCLHRHGIRPPGAREYPRSVPPARSRGIGEFHTTQPNSRPVCVHRRLTRLTPRVRPAGLLREPVHVGEDR